ncbi:MAG: hypothetical protein FJ253_09110, partial [Phycisphaerae bacterium]|nr:hypothetical protein [Phycisphaerae bacterium]
MTSIQNQSAAPSAAGHDPESLTISGYEIEPRYGPGATPTTDPGDSAQVHARIGEPGIFPFTRGIHRAMYRDRLWTMRQFAGFG